MRIVIADDRCVLFHGDSSLLGTVLPENSIDSIVADPPCGIGFMGKEWDDDKGGRDAWVAWLANLLAPAFRALKPGGHCLLWGIPRTSHWTMLAMEAVGFEIRDVIYHGFGTGFPKSLDISKAIDKSAGHWRGRAGAVTVAEQPSKGAEYERTPKGDPITAAAAAAAAAGWGTALKPAVEPWILGRKPLDGTVANNYQRWGTGGINIDASRIGAPGETFRTPQSNPENRTHDQAVQPGSTVSVERMQEAQRASTEKLAAMGRWPAHLVFTHDERCVQVGVEVDAHHVDIGAKLHEVERPVAFQMGRRESTTVDVEIPVFACVAGCPVRALDSQQSGAARFFYCAKPSKKETEHGLDHLPKRSGGEATDREDGSDGLKSPRAGAGRGGGSRNFHPTKKPIALMRYLIKLVTPPGGTVLDVFAGSGTTGVAALLEGMNFIGCELTEDYLPIIEGRLRCALVDSANTPAGASVCT